MADRIVYQPGDVLTTDLGAGCHDLVLLAAVVHDFDAATNRELMRRIARALQPDGIVAIWEPLRQAAQARFANWAVSWASALDCAASRGDGRPKRSPPQPKRLWFGPDLAPHIGQKPA